MYRLIFLNGRHKGRRVAVQQGALLIGRDPACQLDLAEDEQVSHRHAVLEQRGGAIWIKDLGALNRTEVNGQPVEEAQLKPGDRIEIGRTQFEFQLIETAPSGSRRRISQVQVLTFVAIGLVFAVQGLFMFIQFARGPAQVPAAAGEATADLEPDLQRALALRNEGQPAAPAVTAEVVSVEKEVAELRAAVAGLRDQVGDLAVTTTPAAVQVGDLAVTTMPAAVAVEATVPSEAVAPEVTPAVLAEAEPAGTPAVAQAEEPFPVREEPPPLIDVPEAPPARPVEEDPLTARAEEMLALAKEDILRSNLIGADQLLERIQVMAPEYLPAYTERAKLYEKRAMLNKAGEQWALIMDKSKGTPLYATAAATRQRLAQAEVAISTTRKSLDERQANRLPRRIRIVSVDRERFPGSKEFDEMRLVRVNLKSRPGESELDTEHLEVRAYFFDRVIGQDQVQLTEGTVPEQPLRLEGQWPASGARSVTATYILKKGFRQEEEQRTGQKRIYEGYRVQVYYKGELQDEDAQPRALLDEELPAPTESASAAPPPVDEADRPVPR